MDTVFFFLFSPETNHYAQQQRKTLDPKPTRSDVSTNFNDVMSRDRFDQIWRFLHLQDNTDQSLSDDPLRKLR